jgi:hypothetical protein
VVSGGLHDNQSHRPSLLGLIVHTARSSQDGPADQEAEERSGPSPAGSAMLCTTFSYESQILLPRGPDSNLPDTVLKHERCVGPVRTRRHLGFLVYAALALIAALAVLATIAQGRVSAVETLRLNSRSTKDVTPRACLASHGCGPSVTASIVLAANTRYLVKVTGAVGVWSGGNWALGTCGKPNRAPEFGSPGAPSAPVGNDAQFRFASPKFAAKCMALPVTSGGFQMKLSNRSAWFHPIAENHPRKPSTDRNGRQHPYTFIVYGLSARPRFRFVDYHPSDNDGEFRIQILPYR